MFIHFCLKWHLYMLDACTHIHTHTQVSPEEVSYQNKLPFSLKSHPHHVLHFYHPLLINNLLPYNLEITSINKVIGQGESITLDKIDRNDGKKLSIKVGCSRYPSIWMVDSEPLLYIPHVQAVIEEEEYTGSVHVQLKSSECSTFELKSSKSEAELVCYTVPCLSGHCVCVGYFV